MKNNEKVTDIDFKYQLVEQVMRISSDTVLIAKISKSSLQSKSFKSNIGRLLSAHPGSLIPGSPLSNVLGIDQFDPNWRDNCLPAKESLWLQIQFAKEILPPDSWKDLTPLEIYYLLALES